MEISQRSRWGLETASWECTPAISLLPFMLVSSEPSDKNNSNALEEQMKKKEKYD